ncbi:MAG: glycosyltransferase family 2 protein [Holophagaceae bacterium]|nr:glycosyltransferase family 2 protein [Holophagaceae bacterium]
MRVAVISPYFKEPLSQLQRCHASVSAQTHPCRHIFVSDGHPQDLASLGSDLDHILVPNHADFGNTPRAIGGISAAMRHFEGIAFLDGDNWFEPNHIEHMVGLAASASASVVAAQRMLRSPEGELLGVDTFDSDGEAFCDTNCIFLTHEALDLVLEWLMPDDLGVVGDRVFWERVRRSGHKRVASSLPTVNYVTDWAAHYERFGLPVPSKAKRMAEEPDGRLFLARPKEEGCGP